MCKMGRFFVLACWLCSMQMESMYSGAERHSTPVQSVKRDNLRSNLCIKIAFQIPVLISVHKLDPGIISRIDWIEIERVRILLYIHVYVDGPTLPL